jgi:hypothetical protein
MSTGFYGLRLLLRGNEKKNRLPKSRIAPTLRIQSDAAGNKGVRLGCRANLGRPPEPGCRGPLRVPEQCPCDGRGGRKARCDGELSAGCGDQSRQRESYRFRSRPRASHGRSAWAIVAMENRGMRLKKAGSIRSRKARHEKTSPDATPSWHGLRRVEPLHYSCDGVRYGEEPRMLAEAVYTVSHKGECT